MILSNTGVVCPYWVIGVMLFFIYTPLCWVRKIQKFARYHVFADIALLITLVVVVVYAVANVAQKGSFATDVEMINKNNYLIFLGTSIYSFEGAGIVLPIRDVCKYPKDYPKVLLCVMGFLSVLFISFGLFCYVSFGAEELKSAPLVTKLLPSDSILIMVIMVLFMIHLFISYPLTVHPANIIIEFFLYSEMKQSSSRKWLKNTTRTVLVIFTVVFGVVFNQYIDRIVSIIGSFCCIPVAFTLPAAFHLILVAQTPFQKAFDGGLVFFSLVLMFFSTVTTFTNMSNAA